YCLTTYLGRVLWLCTGHSYPTNSVFFFQAEDGIRDSSVTGVQTCALPIYDQTQAPPRTVGPALELSGCGTLEEFAEARADLLVALSGEPEVVLAEPEGHALVELLGAERESPEPELADAARLVHGSILTCCGRTRRASRAAPRIRAWSRGTWSRPP